MSGYRLQVAVRSYRFVTPLEKDHFLGDRILPFVRQSDSNVNIDSNSDLMFARFLVNKGILDE